MPEFALGGGADCASGLEVVAGAAEFGRHVEWVARWWLAGLLGMWSGVRGVEYILFNRLRMR